ncbi:MAG TPA: TIGR01777 family oxidoreductase [Propioniciclava sp.]|jgi:uncharacterized protein (TIGR01777 family)|uniref:TIGR01777 family oxidoreductase n=1 Tax=Propioniciclava sp. TaxID=2038686 RepID=UPI002B773756|nr:TIGR01777 family oxidoreductase [Propioniciclava sp.]HRL48913.1 TIGR01777 family oxidoreductase [Propioniciclava sp.]HRL80084.1 TIGR01777 family oxidoreductase [Propioniciclava sp.]
MPVFERDSRYPFPREEVFAWHARPGAFTRLTPPGMITEMTPLTNGIQVGSTADVVVSHPLLAGLLPHVPRRGGSGPVGVRWRLAHTELEPGRRFVDEQVRGPFASWRHEHLFADGPAGSTIITDRITYQLPATLPGRLPQALVEMQLDGLFAFRERQLRDDLDLHSRLAGPPRRVLIAGSSGTIGTQLAALLTSGGHHVMRLVRGGVATDAVRWDPARGRLDPDAIAGADVAINLAGAPLAGRFTRSHQRRVLTSRVDATTTLARAVAAARIPALVQASAIGLYGPRRPGELLTEESAAGEGLLADVVTAWEGAAAPAVAAGTRTAWMRTGIVLTESGGSLAPQIPLFSVGVGGRMAPADAWLSWISLDDAVRGFAHVALTEAEGPFNLVAPRPVTQRVFAETLGRVLHRPAAVPTPPLAPRLVLGRAGYDQMIDTDQRVSSARLADSGLWFAQGTLSDALRHALMR